MKGLLLKELFTLRKSWFAFTILNVAFAIVGIFGGETGMLLIVPLFMSIWTVSFMNMDEISKWQQYSLALPYGRRKIVSSKYLMILILNASSIVFVVFNYFISVALGKVDFSADLLFTLMLLSLIMGIVYPSLLLPLVYKLNTEKGRMVLMIMNGIVGGMSVCFTQTTSILGDNIFGNIAGFLPFIVVAVVAILYLLSWQLSIKIYEKRDL
ncbi:MAG: ABC-2 transporter permease [Ruminococcus sp.]|nr:ABC-2 transporter permease [Ruminococcus sp.]